MSGVRIPRLERGDLPDTSDPSRVQASVPDATGPLNRIHNSMMQFGGQVQGAMDRYEKSVIDTVGSELAEQYDRWYRTKIYGDSENEIRGLIHQEGDPTIAYNTFDREAIEKQRALLQDSRLSERGRARAAALIGGKHNSLYNQRLVSYGSQHAKWSQQVTDSAVASEKRMAADTMMFMDPSDSYSTAPFEASLGRIRDARFRHAIDLGSAQETEDGPYQMVDADGNIIRLKINDSVKVELAQDISDATATAISGLILSEDFEKADFMLKKYKDNLDTQARGKLEKDLRQLEVKNKALLKLNKLEGKSYPEQKRLIRSMPTKTAKDREIREEALKLIDTNERRHAGLRQRDSTEVYQDLHKRVFDRMRSGRPYENSYEMERDPLIAATLDRVTDPTQRKALYSLVDKKENMESDPDALSRINDLMASGGFLGLPHAEFSRLTSNISTSDTNKLYTQWVRQNSEPESRERANVNSMMGEANRLFQEHGLIRVDTRGRETRASKQQREAFRTSLIEDVDMLPPNMTARERTEWLQARIAQEVKARKERRAPIARVPVIGRLLEATGLARPRETGEVLPPAQPERTRREGGAPTRVVPGASPAPQAPTRATRRFQDLSPQQRLGAMELYRQETGRDPRSDGPTKVMEWFNSRGE